MVLVHTCACYCKIKPLSASHNDLIPNIFNHTKSYILQRGFVSPAGIAPATKWACEPQHIFHENKNIWRGSPSRVQNDWKSLVLLSALGNQIEIYWCTLYGDLTCFACHKTDILSLKVYMVSLLARRCHFTNAADRKKHLFRNTISTSLVPPTETYLPVLLKFSMLYSQDWW